MANKKKKKNPAKTKNTKQQEFLRQLDAVELPEEVKAVDLTKAPEFLHPSSLRPGQQVRFSEAAEGLSKLSTNGDQAQQLDTIDLLMESVAISPEKYVAWLTNGEDEAVYKLIAVFVAYLRLLGESPRSKKQ